ncbi:MAG: hypothetical protein N2Z65_00340, partial [Clostridiales bacterium]|nr:hypothetical protein [Clostridiales bacterium]
MRRKFLSMRNIGPDYNGSVLITMAGFFMIGAIIGSFTASGIMNSGSGRLYEILTNYLSKYTGDYVRPSFLTTLFVNFRYPILIFLISFISVGVIFIPFLVMARGFFLSFAVTGFVRFLGINGAV